MTVKLVLSPLVRLAIEGHVTTLPEGVPPPVALTKVTLKGRLSVTTTFVAFLCCTASRAAEPPSPTAASTEPQQTIVVAGRKMAVKTLVDRKVYDVSGDIQASFGAASDLLSVIPSVEVKVSYYFSNWCRLFVGYDYMYWNQVVRPGSQIDRNVNPTQSTLFGNGLLAGPASPTPLFNRTDFWAQGITVGLEFKF